MTRERERDEQRKLGGGKYGLRKGKGDKETRDQTRDKDEREDKDETEDKDEGEECVSCLIAFLFFLLLAVVFGKVALIACSFASATRTVRTFILSLDRNKYEGKRSAKKFSHDLKLGETYFRLLIAIRRRQQKKQTSSRGSTMG